ncbi:MAG TPA: glycosyltransferase family 2 protein [Steroidobacteraceae bacterium]|nr:glycosyltransferase family 2 protein [Steroidobacteraceae bacterium]
MQVSLIITTYNWPDALALTLASVAAQTLPPTEVIVADDGSGPATRRIVEDWATRLPIQHVWQDDVGFRLARSRNLALAAARGEYIVLIDGDMILHRRFIEDHVACARPDCFVQGARPRLSPEVTARLLATRSIAVSPLSPGLEPRPYAVRNRVLSIATSRIKSSLGGIQGCNQSFWRHHVLQVNGYDERFTGWGPEDREFAARLLHIGVKRHYVRHRAVAFHLHHETRAPTGTNPFDALLAETLRTRATRCVAGIDQHLDSVQQSDRPPG